MAQIDMRDKLKENPFTYKVTKANKMMIKYKHKQIMILNEKETMRMLKRMNGKNEFDIQLELAKVTGNFKRGNERLSK